MCEHALNGPFLCCLIKSIFEEQLSILFCKEVLNQDVHCAVSLQSAHDLHGQHILVSRKPVFWVGDQFRIKQPCSATETGGISWNCACVKFNYHIFQKMNIKISYQTVLMRRLICALCLCCSHATESDFLARRGHFVFC